MKAFPNISQDNYNSIFMNNSFEYYYSIILAVADIDIVPALVELQATLGNRYSTQTVQSFNS